MVTNEHNAVSDPGGHDDTSNGSANGAVTTRDSFCRVCHAACPIEVDIENADGADARVVAIRGVADDPLFEGYTCIKGRQLPDQMHHPDRLRAAYRRSDNGRFEEVGSATALDEIADRLTAIIAEHGPASVATYTGTGGYQNSVALAAARGFHKGIGSKSVYTSVTIDQPAKSMIPALTGWWEGGFNNFRDADVSIAIGYNPMVSSYAAAGGLQGTNPFVQMRRAKARGMKLIVVDPRQTELSTFADVHLQVKPGEDPALLAGMLNVILSEDLADADFCDAWADGVDALAEAVSTFSPEYVAERCEVDANDLVAAARMFAAGSCGTAGTGTGPNMAPNSLLTEFLAIALNVVCGRVNREGDEMESGLLFAPDSPKRAQAIAPRELRTGPKHRFRNLRGYRGEMLCTVLAEEILEPGEGQVRALIVNGGNPAVAFPDQALTMEALRDLELLVVVDHRMTATSAEAHYVIAPTLSLERADIPHLMDRWLTQPYTNYTEAVLEPQGDVLNEWQVFWGLCRRMGVEMAMAGGDLAAIDEPTDDDALDHAFAQARMPMDEVRAAPRTVHPDKAITVGAADPDCTARFDMGSAPMLAKLAEVRTQSTGAEAIDGYVEGEFPFRLVSRRLKATLNSLGPELPGLARKGTTNPAFMHPDDLADLGIESGDLIEITSTVGAINGVCEAAPDVKRGVISMAHSWGDGSGEDHKVRDIGVPTSRLTSTTAAYDEYTGMAVLSAIPVQVRPSQLVEA
jgi:anaerobic selenocysteine-containing dehydrogenase